MAEGLVVHRAPRADALVDALADVLAALPADPFQPELVAVHSNGMERWVSQQLTRRLGAPTDTTAGICANVRFPFFGHVVAAAVEAAGGAPAASDPWQPRRLAWTLVDLLTEHRDADWAAPLHRHLHTADGGPDDAQRFWLARRIADRYDRYAVHRPNLLLAWQADQLVDTAGQPLGDRTWQAELWRLARDRITAPHLAERLALTVEALHDRAVDPDLPSRLSLFGLTALPSSYMAVIGALAAVREVHLFLLHPSPDLWTRLAPDIPTLERRPLPEPALRIDDPTADAVHHPLLASWGRDVREVQTVIAALGDPTADLPIDTDDRPPAETLLRRLQDDLRHDAAESDERPHDLAPDDRSIQVHASHGRTRQVEVLRDALLHLFAADRSLEPRHVIVMCPDIDTFAPHLTAVFGTPAEQWEGPDDDRGIPRLRVRMADRSLRETNPVLDVAATLLDLADGRLPISAVLDLAAQPPVRRRFGFDDDGLAKLDRWIRKAGARWGIDSAHRDRTGVGPIADHTLREALDRALLGLAMADEDDRLVAGLAPLDDVEGHDADLLGRFTEYLARLAAGLARLETRQPIDAWTDAIGTAVQRLTAVSRAEEPQAQQLPQLLADVRDEAGPSATPMTLAEIRDLLADRLRGRPSWAGHRTGDLTVCTLVPMRSVPHRVVCLLGMDDGTFPRAPRADVDDLIADAPRVGDRDARTEDLQLLLDAVLAAGDHLLITYRGTDDKTGQPRTPCVPIAQLIDHLDRLTDPTGDGAARDQLLTRHPLHAFDPTLFTQEEEGQRPWSFDPVARDAARALVGATTVASPFLPSPLPPCDDAVIRLDDLTKALVTPARELLRRRLGVWVGDRPDRPEDAVPVQLDELERWRVGDELVRGQLRGATADAVIQQLRGRRILEPGQLRLPTLAAVTPVADGIVALARDGGLVDQPEEHHPVAVALPDGRRVEGTVAARGDVLVQVQYASYKLKHLLGLWIRLVTVTAAAPDRPWEAVIVARHKRGSAYQPCGRRLRPLGPAPAARAATATAALRDLVALHDLVLCDTVPLPVGAAAAYAECRVDGGTHTDAVEAAAGAWESGFIPGEDVEPAHQVTGGGVRTVQQLLDDPPADGDAGVGQDPEPSRLGTLARRLWTPILAHCEDWP